MLPTCFYKRRNKTKQNKTKTKKRKKCHSAGVKPETFSKLGQRIIHCTTRPLLLPYVKLTFLCPRDKLLKMAQKMQTYDEMSTTKGHP